MNTATVLNFPNQSKEVIESAMDVFLRTGNATARNYMLAAIKKELVLNGLRKMACNGFKVWLRNGALAFDTNNVSHNDKCKCGASFMDCVVLYCHQGVLVDEQIYCCTGCQSIFKIAHRRD